MAGRPPCVAILVLRAIPEPQRKLVLSLAASPVEQVEGSGGHVISPGEAGVPACPVQRHRSGGTGSHPAAQPLVSGVQLYGCPWGASCCQSCPQCDLGCRGCRNMGLFWTQSQCGREETIEWLLLTFLCPFVCFGHFMFRVQMVFIYRSSLVSGRHRDDSRLDLSFSGWGEGLSHLEMTVDNWQWGPRRGQDAPDPMS